MKRTIWTSLALLGLLALPSTLPAQLGGQTSGGTFGSRNLGGSINNPTTGFSGTNQSYSAGVGAASGAASNGNAGAVADGAGQVNSGDRFVRGARQPGQFVGGDSGEARAVGNQNSMAAQGGVGQNGLGGGLGQNARGGLGGGLNGGLGGGLGGLGGGLNQNGRGGTGQLGGLFGQNSNFGGGANSQQRPFRAPIALGFEMPIAARQHKLNTHVEARLTKIPGLQAIGRLNVTMEGETAILRGQVATARDRDLAARLARLEPGISAVKNELEVAPPVVAPAAETIPTPAAESFPPPAAGR